MIEFIRMNYLTDVVNFNADASCLPSKNWIKIISGGKKSDFYKWLELYVTYDRRVNLGIIGASICDIAYYCPEAIELIESNTSIFNVLTRPFSHDNALLRSRESFLVNLDCGIKVTKKYFSNVSETFLPPEFMLLSEQIPILKEFGFSSLLVNSFRLPYFMQQKVPKIPFLVQGLKFSKLVCFPVVGSLTAAYLNAIHNYKFSEFNDLINKEDNPILWRDGESVFLIPDGVDRERQWLKSEAIERRWVDDIDYNMLKKDDFYIYPAHSFLAWMEEFKMFGYLNKINNIEKNIKNLNLEEVLLWLKTINSDVLSSVEKKDVSIEIVNSSDKKKTNYVIQRTHRGYEGEEFLHILEDILLNDRSYMNQFLDKLPPHAHKYIARYKILQEVC